MKAFQKKITRVAETPDAVVFMGPEREVDRWIEPPPAGKILMLAPHPDDGEAVGVTLKIFAEAGCEVFYIIACLSPGGVTDGFALAHAEREGLKVAPADLPQYKKTLRRAEQLESARLAGFPGREPEFLALEEGSEGRLVESRANAEAMARVLAEVAPDVSLMPIGEDTNIEHVQVYRWLSRAAAELAASRGKPILGLYNRDPKTLHINEQLIVPFDEQLAGWKAKLLATHRSQQERNLAQRGHGLDQRILRVNRPAWERVKKSLPPEIIPLYTYAEVFQVEIFR